MNLTLGGHSRLRASLLAFVALCMLAPAVPSGQLGGQFESPVSVAVDVDGNIYVSERERHRIDKLDLGRNVAWRVGTLGSGDDQFNNPSGIAVAASGSIYVADTYNARVQKLNSNGASIARWGSYGSGQGQFHRPVAIALDSSENVYVLDSELRRVQKFNNDGGAYYGSWGTVGTGDGEFTSIGGGPRDIVIDSAGNAYATDTAGYRIHKWQINSDATGNITTVTFLGWSGRCVSGPNCDTANQRSRGFTCTAATCSAGSPGGFPGQFINPMGLAVSAQGSLFVADFDNNRIQKFDNSGSFEIMWGHQGTDSQGFRGPIDIAAHGTDAVYVADWRNKRIVKFTHAGAPLAVLGGDVWLSAFPGSPPVVDALVDPNPSFVLPGQTRTSTLTIGSLYGFAGTVNVKPGQATLSGTTIVIAPTWVDVPSNAVGARGRGTGPGSATATISIAAGATATPGAFTALIQADNGSLGLVRAMYLFYEVIPVAADSTAPPCPGWYQRGTTPEVLPLRALMVNMFRLKAMNPLQTKWIMGALTKDSKAGWQLTIDKATGLTPPLSATEALVVVTNPTRSLKGVLAINGVTCGLAPSHGVVLSQGDTGSMRISTADTTTLVLSEFGRDIAVFSENNFWTFFGGRRLTIDWVGPP